MFLEKEINIAISVRLTPPDTRLCTSEKGGGWAVGWGSEAENFPLVVSPTELLARLESDAA